MERPLIPIGALVNTNDQINELAATFSLFQIHTGNGVVTFSESDDPPIISTGRILETGTDINGPWALLKVIARRQQLATIEQLLPGYSSYFNSYYTEMSQIAEAFEDQNAIEEHFPETNTYVSLTLPRLLVLKRIKDIAGCVFCGEEAANI